MKKLKFLIALIVLFSCLTLGVCAVEQPSEINVGYVAKYGTVTSAFYEDTKGYGYEYLNGLLAYMDGDYTLNFVSCTSWQDGLDKLDSGEIDIIGPMFETAAGDVCYTSENFGECTLILASVDNAQGLIDDLSALDGSTIGVPDYYPDYSVLTNFLQEQGIDADIMVLPSLELNITLGMNEVDYVFMSSLQTQLGLTVVTYIDAQPVYFVGAPESQALLDEIDQALIALKAAEPVFESQLALKYSSYNYTANAYISEENYALLQEKGTYTVGVRNFNSPLLQENGNGELEGVAFVMLDMLSEAGNISFEYVELDDSATIEDCQNIDFLVAATDDTLALGFPYESGSYLSLPCLLLDRTNKETIETIGVASDYRISNLLEDGKLYGREVVQYATVSELQEAFDADEVDSILFTVISFNMIRDQFQNQDFIASTVDDDLEFVMAFSEDLTAEELTVFNKLIANLDQSVLDAALIEYAVTPQATSLLTMIKDNPWVVFNLVVGIMVLIVISAIVSERKRRLLLSKIIDYDELTGLSSKRKLMQDAQVLMEKNPTIQYDFLSMDIDNFKHINEMYGYQTGSELLKIIARNIGQRLTPTTLFARATGDHFLMFFERDGQGSTEQWLAFEKELQHSIYTQLDIVAHTTFSMGIYEVKDPSMDINIMIDYANIARTHGKGTIGFTCYYFTAEMAEASTISNRITTEMVPAIQNEEFVLYYQPKFELKTERTIGAEVLVRWIKDGTVIPPNRFIPLFEKNGFIQTLDYYVLSHTCKFLQTYQHLAVPRLSVNLSGVTMLQEDVVERVMEILNQYQVVPAQIDLEITETAFVANSAIQASLKALQHMGFTISIDDFGTGVSSLSRLRYMDLDTLKIDREFIIDALDDKRGNSILNHVIEIAKDLDLETVAEGIETADQLNYLREIGCDVGQGFYYARPMPEAVFVVSCEKLTQEGKC